MGLLKDSIANQQLQYQGNCMSALSRQVTVVDRNDVATLEDMAILTGPQDSIQVLPAATYLTWGVPSLRYWASQYGVFSIPTVELAEWISDRYLNQGRSIHEIGCGNGALAAFLKIHHSDYKQNQMAQEIAQSLGGKHAVIPKRVATKEGNAAIEQYKPDIALAQWVTPGGGSIKTLEDTRNGYGPIYADILENCKELVFIGNDSVHNLGLEAALPIADEEYRFDWLLSRSQHQEENFIRIWKGSL